MQKAKIAVQGSGKVGGTAARIFYEKGYTVVAVSDVNTGLYNEKGLNIEEISRYVETKETLLGYTSKGTSEISNSELLKLDVDILVPAAMENQITVSYFEWVQNLQAIFWDLHKVNSSSRKS